MSWVCSPFKSLIWYHHHNLTVLEMFKCCKYFCSGHVDSCSDSFHAKRGMGEGGKRGRLRSVGVSGRGQMQIISAWHFNLLTGGKLFALRGGCTSCCNEATRQVGNLPAAVPSAVVVVVAATLGQVMHTCLAKLSWVCFVCSRFAALSTVSTFGSLA